MASRKIRATSTHSTLVGIPGYLGSKARWAVQPSGQAVVFVHGFSGTAVGTWVGFDEMLTTDPRANGLDIFFYGYDTWRTEIRHAARKLFRFLHALHKNDSKLVDPSLIPGRKSFAGYQSILICAHSLGGLVTRWALLDAHKIEAPWACSVASILFAPAHLAIANNLLSRLGSRLSLPVKQMLERYNLEILRHETELALGNNVSQMLTPKAVVQAEYEKWVMVGAYEKDPACYFVADATHTSICNTLRRFASTRQQKASTYDRWAGADSTLMSS